MPGHGHDGSAPEGRRRDRRSRAAQPRTLARRALPRPLRGRRGNDMSSSVAVVARSVSRRHRRSALIWGGTFALLVVSSVTGYSSAYPKVADRLQLQASLGNNAGVRALFGQASNLDTVGGFTAWRSTVLVTLVGGVWALLLATKALRGEEDEGRMEVLLSGPLTHLRGTAAILTGLGTTMVIVFAGVAIGSIAAGRGGGHFSVSAAL